MQPLTLIRRPALTQTLTLGAGGGAYSASFSSESGSAHPLTDLSMGMTNDFEVAVEEGATLVRIGTALFEGLTEEAAV